MLVGGANLLAEARAEIDALNVFPVPDGDTGTNMYLTMLAGVKEAQQVESVKISDVTTAMAQGCLLGARGNSGVILSQIFSGFAEALAGMEKAGATDIARAFSAGAEAAYQAVGNPVEGTILTVCNRTAAAVNQAVTRSKDPVRVIIAGHRVAKLALEETPELLPVLKEAGVVDAGGKGFLVILEGIIRALKDAAAKRNIELFDLAVTQQKEFAVGRARDFAAEIDYVYCTEFVIMGRHIPVDALRQELTPYGDCLLVVGDNQAVKVHIHSNHPGLVLECGLKYGALHNVAIDNMEKQSQELLHPASNANPDKNLGIVAVGAGEGISTILKSLGVDVVVKGGQTMNPSAEELLQAVSQVQAESVILLPNNKNILLAAQQASSLASKKTGVVPTISIPQCFAALLSYLPWDSLEENLARMKESLTGIKTGYVTKAVRDTVNGGRTIARGDFIGLMEDELVAAGSDLEEVTGQLVDAMQNEDVDLATLYFGAGLPGTEAQGIMERLELRYDRLDFELHYGGQPLYHFIISVE